MGLIRACAVVGFAAGCATAGQPGNGQQDGSVRIDDGPNGGQHDAPKLDAPRQLDAPSGALHDAAISLTLSETLNSTMVYGDSIACSDTGNGDTRDNIWYRAYQLSDFSITDAFTVSAIAFAVQESAATPTVTVKLGTYSGTVGGTTINSAQITSLAMTTVVVPATSGETGETVMVPLAATIPAGGKFVVQLSAPDQDNVGYMYIGATTAGETQPGYISSSACTITTPTLTTTEGGTGQIIINVIGSH